MSPSVAPAGSGTSGVTLADFRAYAPTHVYIFMPCREPWTGTSVNSILPKQTLLDHTGNPLRKNGKLVKLSPTQWLDLNQRVEQMTWAPGFPELIVDRLVVDGGWIERPDVTCLNLYRPPRIIPGEAAEAELWLSHVHEIYNADDARHIIDWLAQRVQHPAIKINHALVLGGAQGIGKDTLLEPVKYAVGPWNFREVSPPQLLGRFNAFIKSVILRVSEARDLGDADRVNRFTFYDHTKVYTAAPPDVLRVDEKHLREHYVFNCLGFLVTTNHKTDGLYLPSDDRRHYVAWSDRRKEEFTPAYWTKLWRWYQADNGFAHVTAYLQERDLSGFDPKAPPPQTPAFWEIVSTNRAPEDAELADAIDVLENPEALTPKQLVGVASGAFAEWLSERRSRRALPHRLERCGYVAVKNPDAKDDYWVIQKIRQSVYAKNTLTPAARLAAASNLQEKLTREAAVVDKGGG